MASNITKTIRFSNVRLLLSIGIHKHERTKRQNLSISLAIGVAADNENDNIANTLDYDRVYDFLKSLETERHFDLQETVCRKIIDFVLNIDGVECVEVSTKKTDVYDATDYVGLTMRANNRS